MPLPSTGTISMSQVNVELGRSSTATISLGESAVRSLAGVASGGISLQNLRGKSAAFAFSITSNQTNANLRTLAVNAGWDQSSAVQATINSGVTISSNSTGTYALTIDGSWPGGVTLVNNGTIVGMGGAGGRGHDGAFSRAPIPGTVGFNGGPALIASSAVSINNAGTIAGGGGGGGGGGALTIDKFGDVQGGGGGGGRSSLAANSAGGLGGTPGNPPYSATNQGYIGVDGYPGGNGTFSSAGAGGSGSILTNPSPPDGGTGANYSGGNGGNWGAAGASGGGAAYTGSFTPTINAAGYAGGAGGAAVVGNSNISWIATGTRYGGIT